VVEDSGAGVDPAIADRIFDPFFTTKERAAGTGLGLSVSHGNMKEHGGELRFESEPGTTRFCVELPVEEVSVPPPTPRSALARRRS
jgi:signal transduction histidine kinase